MVCLYCIWICIYGTLKFDSFLLKVERSPHSSQPSVLPVNPVRSTSAGCLHGSRSGPFFFLLQAAMCAVVKLSITQDKHKWYMTSCALSTNVKVPLYQLQKMIGGGLQGQLLRLHVQMNKQRFVLFYRHVNLLREHGGAPAPPLTPNSVVSWLHR